jgi:Holliday junction resolvase
MSASDFEREYKRLLEADGIFVIRSAGSKAVDLVAYDPKTRTTHFIEVKAIGSNVFRVTKNKENFEQWKEMCRLVKALRGAEVYYAIRRKGGSGWDAWTTIEPKYLKRPYHWGKGVGKG